MKKIITLLGIVLVIGAGWYFVSPLFLNKEVNEELPIDQSAQALNDSDKQGILNIFKERIAKGELTQSEAPTLEELNAMSVEDIKKMEEDLMKMMTNEPDSTTIEIMPALGENPSFPLTLASGTFTDADTFHKGSGDATIIDLDGTSRILRLENFSVTNGPDLRVYLSEKANPTTADDVISGASIELSQLKGNKGNQNYEIPDSVDIDAFGSVVIYCKPFHVIFASANL